MFKIVGWEKSKVAYAVNGTSALIYEEGLIESYSIGPRTAFLKIRSAEKKGQEKNRNRLISNALKFPYIQPNSKFNIRWLVFDIDREFDVNEIYDNNLPPPYFVVFNPENGHAHLWYRLESPIFCQDAFKNSKPYKYYKAVYKALCKALKADIHFNKTLCKNPIHASWKTVLLYDHEYDLGELASHLDINWQDLPQPKKSFFSRNKVNVEALEEFSGVEKGSRNSELFEFCRHKAYRKRMVSDCSESEFIEWCCELVAKADAQNPDPLSKELRGDKELRQIGESIGYWTWANLEPLKIKASQYDDAARERSLMVRKKAAAKKLKKLERYLKKHPQESNRAISRALGDGFSTDTVNRMIRTIKANKEAQAAKSRASRAEVVGKVPQDDSISERFVNQVVKAVGLLNSGLSPG